MKRTSTATSRQATRTLWYPRRSRAAGPLQGTPTAKLSSGVASFTTLADNTAEAITIKFGSGSLTPATSGTINVNAAPANHLVVTTQPPSPITSGQGFGLVVTALDQFNNVDTSYTGSISISVANYPSFTTSVQSTHGVATFSGLIVDASVSGLGIQVATTGLHVTGTTTNPRMSRRPRPRRPTRAPLRWSRSRRWS